VVDALERDRDLVTLARLLNAYHRVTRVSFFERAVGAAATYSQPYDVVLALSDLTDVQPVLESIAPITEGVFLAELPAGSNDHTRSNLNSLERWFPATHVLEVSADAGRSTGEKHQFAVCAKARADLHSALRSPAEVAATGRGAQ
jgi:hypothetical protein